MTNTSNNSESIYLLGPARTPIGKVLGGLASIPATVAIAFELV